MSSLLFDASDEALSGVMSWHSASAARANPPSAPHPSSPPSPRHGPESGPRTTVDREQALLERARMGDTSAFSALVVQHQARALALATSVVRDENDASEIVQEAFLRAYRSLDRFAGDSSFFTWFYRIVSNLCIDFLRKPQRRDSESIDPLLADERGELTGRLEPAQSPFDELVNKELQQHIARCLGRLPPYHRGVIEMRELRGMSYEEMAIAMGVSKGTIMSRLFHARQKLQRSLRDCNQLPR